jgi:DNA (cytosine-5)-methyltransferase 1
VLAKHWPQVRRYEDVRKLTAARLAADGIAVDAICGGFPCQDLSVAGKRAGIEGERSGLWSEFARLIGEIRPRVVFVENVTGLLSGPSEQPGGWFGRVLGDLAECGYNAEWRNIPACMVGAPHRRERVWIVAYASELLSNGVNDHARFRMELSPLSKLGNDGWSVFMANTSSDRLQGQRISWQGECPRSPREGEAASGRIGTSDATGSWWRVEPNVGRVAYGVPQRVDRLKSLGNAVVPQIPELLGRAYASAMGVRP